MSAPSVRSGENGFDYIEQDGVLFNWSEGNCRYEPAWWLAEGAPDTPLTRALKRDRPVDRSILTNVYIDPATGQTLRVAYEGRGRSIGKIAELGMPYGGKLTDMLAQSNTDIYAAAAERIQIDGQDVLLGEAEIEYPSAVALELSTTDGRTPHPGTSLAEPIIDGGETIDPKTGRKLLSSAGRFFGWQTIYGRDGGADSRYMTRAWIGRLRLHIFHRGDEDPDPHDHPWDFWTFPLTSYVEEVTVCEGTVFDGFTESGLRRPNVANGDRSYDTYRRVVPAFRWSFRAATHTHRVIGRYWIMCDPFGDDVPVRARDAHKFPDFRPLARRGKIVTIVWRSAPKRKWGFLKNRDGKYCWQGWKDYVKAGGRSAPCE